MSTTPSEVTKASEWADMNAFQRNWLIGEMMKAEPLRDYCLRRDGKTIGRLAVKSAEEAESWLRIANMSLTNWVKLMPEVPYECRAEVTIHVDSWHIRYSDTPGGGWEVIEWLRKRGTVWLESMGLDGWLVRHEEPDRETYVQESARTMAEAACKVALRVV
jgi:hypothetical protein